MSNSAVLSVPQTVLFLCTGNFYRSRYAEALFNHAAERDLPEWRAESRGFRPKDATEELSHYIRTRLHSRGIPQRCTREVPALVEERDLAGATRIVAMLESEHRPMMRERFPSYENRSCYWRVHDIDVSPPEDALPLIEKEVDRLVSCLKSGHALPADASPAEF